MQTTQRGLRARFEENIPANAGEEIKMGETDTDVGVPTIEEGGVPPDFAPDFEEGGSADGKVVLPQDAPVVGAPAANMAVGDVSRADYIAAQRQLGREMDVPIDGYLAQVERQKVRRAQLENRSPSNKPEEEIKAKMVRSNIRLEEKLAPLMKAEKERLESRQYTGFMGKVRKTFGFKPKTIDSNMVLNNVINGLISAAEEITEKRFVRLGYRKEERDESRGNHRELSKERNVSLDAYEVGEKHLTSLEEQLTENIKARDGYIEQTTQPGYKGDVDALLQNTSESIDHLEDQKSKVEEGQEELSDQIADYNAQVDQLKREKESATVHFKIAQRNYQDARAKKRALVAMRDDRQKRESLLKAYTSMLEEDRQLDHGEAVTKESEGIVNDIIKLYNHRFNAGNGGTAAGDVLSPEMRSFKDNMDKVDANEIAKARAERYALS
jgi:hypothetical protein